MKSLSGVRLLATPWTAAYQAPPSLGFSRSGVPLPCGFGVTLGCLYLGAQGCVPCCWRVCLVCLALKLVGPCVVLGFSAGMEAFDELLPINVPWSQELPGVRVWT